MFGLFGKKKEEPLPAATPDRLYLKSNDAGFEYACKLLPGILKEGEVFFGQIVKQFKQGERGTFKFSVRLAVEPNVVETDNCDTAMDGYYSKVGGTPPELKVGDLVLISVGMYDPDFEINRPMQTFFILAKANPEINPATKELMLDKGL